MTTRSGAGGTICSGSLAAAASSRLVARANLVGAGTLLAEALRPFLSPDADDADGGWTTELGGTTLFPSIDEMLPDDSDYIQSTDEPAADVCRFRLTDPATTLAMPASVRVRAQRSGAGLLNLVTRLKEGSTLIAEWEEENVPATLTTFTYDLLQAEFDAIGDQTNLFIELQADTALEAETGAWAAAVVTNGGTVSGDRLVLVNDLIAGLKTDGIWTKFDRLWLFAAENTPSALTDIISTILATTSGSPGFTVDRGYVGDATDNIIDSGFNASTAPSPKFVRDSASLFAWNAATADDGTVLAGGGTGVNRILPTSGGSTFYTINGGGDSFANVNTVGFFHCNRSAAAATQFYINGSSVDSGTGASVAPANKNLVFLALDVGLGFLGNGRVACGGFGSSLDATEADALYDRLRTYMDAVGVP